MTTPTLEDRRFDLLKQACCYAAAVRDPGSSTAREAAYLARLLDAVDLYLAATSREGLGCIPPPRDHKAAQDGARATESGGERQGGST